MAASQPDILNTPCLNVRLLGDFAFIQDERPLPNLDAPRLQAFLTLLLLRRDAPQLRRHLAFQLWPDSNESQARTNLRNLLHRLRQSWPQAANYVQIKTKSVQWLPTMPYTLDVAEFERALAAAVGADTTAAITHLQQAISHYQGDLLPGCYDEWSLPERSRLRQRFLDALERLIDLLTAQQDWLEAIRRAQRLLREEPLREVAYRRLMHLYLAYGDRAAALRMYHTCAAVLEQELGVPPGAETEAIHQQLLATAARPSAAPPATSPPTPDTARLIGRRAAWQHLLQSWRTAKQGAPHMILIEGEAGIGKSRLAQELLAWARRQGVTTAVTTCYAAAADLAFAPLVGWLQALPLERLAPLWRSELSRLVPQLLVDDPNLPLPGPLTESWQQQRFFTALTQAVQPTRQPVLLLLDDIHWADAETLGWLHVLLRSVAPERLLLLATLRREERIPPALADLLTACRQNERLTTLSLERLTAAETTALAADLLHETLDTETADALYRHSEGNPLFIVETARAMQGNWRLVAADRPPLPDKVQAMLESRLAQLSSSAREVTNLAAAVGRSFTFDVLAQASDLNEDRLVAALDELWQRRIVTPQGESSYDFSHGKLRQVVYDGLSPARRRWLHGRICDALQTLYHHRLDEVIGALAHHAERAGRRPETARYALQAGQLALNRFAYHEAVAHFNQALTALPAAAADALYAVLSGRAQAWHALHDQAALHADLTRLQQLAEEQANVQWQAEVAWRQAEFAWLQGEQAVAQQLAETGLALARQADDGAREAAFMETLARIARNQGDYRQAREWVTQAHERFTAVGDRFGQASTLDKLANLTFEAGGAEQAAAMHAEAARMFRHLQATPYEFRALSGRALALKALGDYEEARQTHLQILSTAESLNDRHNQWTQQLLLGNVAYELGDYETAVHWYTTALALARQLNNPRDLSMTLNNLGEAYREKGESKLALRYYQEGLVINREKGYQRGEANCLNGMGLAYLDQQQTTAARTALLDACALWQTLGERLKLTESRAALALAVLAGGQLAEAQKQVEAALNGLDHEQDHPMWRRWVYLAAYRVWLAVGEKETAVAYLKQAAQAVADISARLPPEANAYFQQARINQEITAARKLYYT